MHFLDTEELTADHVAPICTTILDHPVRVTAFADVLGGRRDSSRYMGSKCERGLSKVWPQYKMECVRQGNYRT